MTWAGLVLKNLLRRKVRTGLTVAGVAIGVGLIVALLSITAGVKSTANQLIHVGRSDFGLFQQGASDLTRSVLPQSLYAKVKADPGVADAAQIFIRVGKVENQDEFLLFGFATGRADRAPERRDRRPARSRSRGDGRGHGGQGAPPPARRLPARRQAEVPDRRASTTRATASSTSAPPCR